MNETINTIGVATVAAIIVICYLIGMIVKASPLQDKWIPIVCGVCGGAGLFHRRGGGHHVRPDGHRREPDRQAAGQERYRRKVNIQEKAPATRCGAGAAMLRMKGDQKNGTEFTTNQGYAELVRHQG